MTPEALAALHARCFLRPRPWSAAEFAALLAAPGVVLVTAPEGFAPSGPPAGYLGKDEGGRGFLLGRVAAGEAEVLTLAVDPGVRRQGLGAGLLAGFLRLAAERGACRVFLEVAADNGAALALYARAGLAPVGRRRGYFAVPGLAAVDALVLACDLPGS